MDSCAEIKSDTSVTYSVRAQELCESRGGRNKPTVSVDVKQHSTNQRIQFWQKEQRGRCRKAMVGMCHLLRLKFDYVFDLMADRAFELLLCCKGPMFRIRGRSVYVAV